MLKIVLKVKVLTVLSGIIAGVLLLSVKSVVQGQTGWVDDGTVVRLETSTDRVGIGTSNPSQKLEIQNGGIVIGNRGDGFSDLRMVPGDGTETHLYSYSGGGFGIQKYGAGSPGGEVFRITNSGNVGIGTTSPATTFAISSNGVQQIWMNAFTNEARISATSSTLRINAETGGAKNTEIWDGVTTPILSVVGSTGNVGMTGNLNVTGQVTAAGKNLNNASIQRADYIIYRDTDSSYKAVRLSDGVVTHSHATDAAAVINGLLSSLGSALYHSPSNPNPDFREGRKIVLGHGVFNVYQTIVIPPNQDFIFEADRVVINTIGLANSDIIRIDSSMNSKFTLPIIVSNGDGNTAVRIKPQTQGPDDCKVFTTSELYIEAVVGSQDGLTLDASAGSIEFLRGEIKEINLFGGTSTKRGIYIGVPGSGSGFCNGANNVVRGNELKVLRVNAASEVAKVVNNSNVRKNLFWINNADNEGVPINVPTTNNNKVKASFPTGW